MAVILISTAQGTREIVPMETVALDDLYGDFTQEQEETAIAEPVDEFENKINS